MKLVKFKNGQYGIRRFWLIPLKYEYLDFECPCYWHKTEYPYFKSCKTTKKKAQEHFEQLTDKGEPVKIRKVL